MWTFVVFVALISWCGGHERNARQQQPPGWDIRLAVPGDPGNDYPTLGNIPRTSFSCSGKAPGYYADLETNCQAFRVCTSGSTYGFQSFLCPNGTLFNQAVVVCDWWMNVDCQKSGDFVSSNNDKFGNLRLGPQLMKDVKKMITHPMRNPYDKTIMKSNLIVMQDYKPPANQMFGALLSGNLRSPNSVYVPAKQVQQPYYSNNVFAASTPSPSYVPPAFNSIPSRDTEVFQRQRQNGQYQQSGKLQLHPSSQISNGQYQQSGRLQQSQISNGQYQQSGKLQQSQISNGQYQQNDKLQQSQISNGQYQQNGKLQQSQISNGQYQQSGKLQQSQISNGQYQQSGKLQQSQISNGQYQQSGKLQQSQISNGHAAQFSQNQNSGYSYNNVNSLLRPTQTYNSQAQYRQQQNTANAQPFNQRGQYRQSGQYTDGRSQAQSSGKTTEYGISYQKQQFNNALLNNVNTGHISHEAKENLVSDETPATIVTKTLTFNRIVDPEPGKPKSRITIKTWFVKPTKAAKLIAEPTAYNYARPTNPPSERQVVAVTPYTYNPPTTIQSARIIQTEGPYSYNKPTQAAKQVEGPYNYNKPTVAAKQVEGPYVYNRPTVAAKQVATPPRPPPREYLPPTSPPPTLSRLYLNPTTAPPTLPSRLYIPPTTYKPAAKLYIPPSQTSNLIVSRQYLAPSAIQQPAYYQSEKLQASPTSPTPVYALPNENPSYSVTKHSHIKSNHNNLTFSDILTKEKLDITVNDIVSETGSILKTASPIQQLDQYRQEKDYSDESYIQSENESDERLTSQTPTVVATSARLVQGPATDLEPPVETYDSNQNVVNTNRLATLPFYKEPGTGTNTIERTVSLKISIPEKVASYLFKSHNESEYDKLEILNTGSSNYLVLTNNITPKEQAPGANFIPIGRLIADKTTNISDSQALVFNFLADSLNAAKEYSNIAKQNIVTPTPAQFQAVNNQELARITNQISQLTASQYSNQNNYNHGNIVSSAQIGGGNQYQSAKYTNGYTQNQQQINSAPARLTSQQGYAYQNPNTGFSGNLQINPNQNQIYSGQLYKLPVPDVTNHIYNAGSANLVQGHQYSSNQNGNGRNQQSSSEVEIVQSHTLPISAPAKLQQFTPNEPETFSSHEHNGAFNSFLSNTNGISAQLQDKIVGTIPHPIEDNKYVTYKKDQSYFIHTKLNNNAIENTQSNNIQSGQSAKLIQGNSPNLVFQFVPSVSYQLEDEKEQQKILNAFQIDEYGSPKNINQQGNRRQDLISEVDYAVEHPQSAKQVDGQFNEVNTLYQGPSSYSAPQASVGSLEANEVQNNPNARLEQLEESGYGRVTPANQFSF